MDINRDIPLELIYWPDPTDITDEQINNMALSVMVHGQIEEIVVNTKDKNGYRGVCGRLRYEGMKYRWRGEPEGKTIRARIHKFESEMEIKMWQLAENLHRRQLPAMAKARQLKALFDIIREEADEEATLQTLASAVEDATGDKQSIKTLQHYLTLTKLAPKAQEVLTSEKMPLRAGLELARIKDHKKQAKAAKKIQKHPDQYTSVQAVKWHVDEVVAEERRERQKQRLEKKAEELRSQGKIVIIDSPYGDLSWEDRQKYHRFWDEPPAKCKGCPNLGIELTGNFQQKPMCADPDCYNKMQEEKRERDRKELEERTETLRKEQEQVYTMEPDERHWRLALVGLIDPWSLRHLLGIEREEYEVGGMMPTLWKKVQSLDEKECKRLLIKKAVETILTGPQRWRGDTLAKKWAVEEFELTHEVFLAEKNS